MSRATFYECARVVQNNLDGVAYVLLIAVTQGDTSPERPRQWLSALERLRYLQGVGPDSEDAVEELRAWAAAVEDPAPARRGLLISFPGVTP